MTGLITKIKRYRDKYNMTQKELADRGTCEKGNTIVRLEQGKYNPVAEAGGRHSESVLTRQLKIYFPMKTQEKTASDSTEKE